MTRRFQEISIWTLVALVFGITSALADPVTLISDVTVEDAPEGTCVLVSADGPLRYADFTLPDPDRIVVDVLDTERPGPLETLAGPEGSGVSEVRVSQYALEPRPVTRVVVETDHRAPYIIKPLEGGLLVLVNPVQEAGAGAEGTPVFPAVVPSGLAARIPSVPPEKTLPEIPDDLITLDFQDADIQTVIRSFSEYGNVNIIAGPEVKGLVTVHLEDVPWPEALDMVLRAHGFCTVKEGNMIRVGDAQSMQNEELTKRAAERKKEELLPLETKVIKIDFADAEELREPLRKILTSRGSIEVEPRTNTILVTDIATSIERVEDLIAELDTRTRQVEINAKLVDVDASVTRELGIDWTALELNIPGVSSGKGEVEIAAGVMAPVGQFTVGRVEGTDGVLDATLSALEKENKASIISSPRITTLDNMEAKILVGKKIPLIVSDEAGNPITELTTIGIQMTVTPHINDDGEITLDLHPEVSDLAAQATVQGGIIILTSEARTRVMVADGQTAVIGGLMRNNETEFVTGVPLLRSLPLIGRLFRSQSTTLEKRELLIFVTPRIVN